jgi:very-short-patch-repair endonuclease
MDKPERENSESRNHIREDIVRMLRERPKLKARQIADILNIDRRQVNSILWGELRNRVSQDNQYRWSLRSEAATRETDEADAFEKKDTPLSKLCDYYLECLNYDNFNGLSVFASSKYDDPDYVEISQLPIVSDEPVDLFDEEPARRLWRKVRRERSRLTLVLGYPIRLKKISARSGWEGFIVEPILLFGFQEQEAYQHDLPILAEDLPQINFKAIQSLTNAESSSIIDEVVSLSEELGLAESSVESPDLDEILPRLKEIRPEWDWREDPDPYNLNDSPRIPALSEIGIYNRAIIFVAERSPYTKGLETELAALRTVPEEKYRETALGFWLNNDRIESPPSPNEPLLEVLPLNSEQREAVIQGLSNPLTVITGPPGTGKSQVVTSLLINAAWQGKSVLFASKNNKAVDIVGTRTNSLGPRPVLLRLGRNEFQNQLVEYLISLLAASTSPEDEKKYEEFLDIRDRIQQHFQSLENDIHNILELRNEVDLLEQEIEFIRGEVNSDFFRLFKSDNPDAAQAEIKNFKRKIRDAIKKNQPFLIRLLWGIFKNSRYSELDRAASSFSVTAKKYEVYIPQIITNDQTIEQWHEVLGIVDRHYEYAIKIHQYFKRLDELTRAKPLESINKEYLELIHQLANTSLSLWQTWLSLQPKRMTRNDRSILSDYSSLLQMIVASNNEQRRVGSQILKRYHSLFPQIINMLSCWAVTSLAARGRVPFEPGFFDILIIDEASQCDIASALPLLYRAKRAVIIGDPKQLRHISGLPVKQDSHLLEKNDLVESHGRWAYSVNSLFDLASGLCSCSEDIVQLRDHHRSHVDIIEFSNHQFYEGKLRIATNYHKLHFFEKGKSIVRWLNVSGKVVRPPNGSAVNEREARAVVEELERIVLRQGYKGTIGVVSPFRAQALRIRDLVLQNDSLSERLFNLDFLPYTVDGFQGDERDLMIFSPVISSGISAGAMAFLRSRPNLFNVAVTRARAALVVIGDKQAALDSGVEYLSRFAKYVEELGSRKQQIVPQVEELGPNYPLVAHPERVSEWEEVLYKALFREGHRPIPQYEVEKYDLDFALFDGERKLNIEVDGERYHRNWDGELCRHDQIRNQRLIELGWDVMRFWVYQIRDDLDSCVSRVRKWIENGSIANEIGEDSATIEVDGSVNPSPEVIQRDKPERERHITRHDTPASISTEERKSYSRYYRENIWRGGIHTPFPEEFSTALHHLYEANRLEKEGADQNLIDQELEKAHQLDPNATAYYISRWNIMKESRRKKDKK